MHCIKLLGDKLSARSFDSQVNEIHARVAVLNRFTELGRPLIKLRLKFGSIRGALHFKSLCNKAIYKSKNKFKGFYTVKDNLKTIKVKRRNKGLRTAKTFDHLFLKLICV